MLGAPAMSGSHRYVDLLLVRSRRLQLDGGGRSHFAPR